MDEELLVDYINLYRHDLMNHLQLVHGYSQLNNTEQVNEKLTEVLTMYAEERTLFKLGINKFVLFVLFINHHYPNMKIDCNVLAEGSKLLTQDKLIYEQTSCLMDYFSTYQKEMMYHWLLEIKYDKIKEVTRFTFKLQQDKISHLNIREDIDSFTWNYPIEIIGIADEIQLSFIVTNEL